MSAPTFPGRNWRARAGVAKLAAVFAMGLGVATAAIVTGGVSGVNSTGSNPNAIVTNFFDGLELGGILLAVGLVLYGVAAFLESMGRGP